MTIRAFDPFVSPEAMAELGAEHAATVEELLSRSAHVSLHLPATADNRGLLNAERLALVPQGTILVNTARGELVDTEALVEALDRGHLAGAGLDVTAPEPLHEGHPLLSHPRVLLTPHLGGQTSQAMQRVAQQAVESIVAAHDGLGIPRRVA